MPTEGEVTRRTLSIGDRPFDVEIVSTVVPPGTNASCPGGRAFVSYSGTSVIAPFECLSAPDSEDCKKAGGLKASPFVSQQTMPVYQLDYELGQPVCLPSQRLRQPRYRPAGTDTDGVRTPTSVLQVKAYWEFAQNDATHACDHTTPHGVNFVRRSSDCGERWTYSNPIDATSLADPDAAGNADFPFLYYDRTSNKVFLMGHTGPYAGGVNIALTWRSDDDGRTFHPLPGSRMPAYVNLLTSVGDGTSRALVAFGCHPDHANTNDGVVHAYVSYDDGEAWDRVPDATWAGAPLCAFLHSSGDHRIVTHMAGNASSIIGPVVNAIAYRDPAASPPGTFEVRVAWSFLEPDATGVPGHARQVLAYGLLSFPRARPATPTATYRPIATLRPEGGLDSIFRGSFTQPWLPGPLAPGLSADDAVLWTIDAHPTDETLSASFRTVRGEGTFGPWQPLSASRSTSGAIVPRRWRPHLDCRAVEGEGVGLDATGRLVDAAGARTPGYWWCFNGDYDRGTAWVDPSGRIRMFHTWSESREGVAPPNAFLHHGEIVLSPRSGR